MRSARDAQAQGKLTLSKSCRLHGVSRQAIYQRLQRHQVRSAELAPIQAMVQDLRCFMPRLGTRKLYYLLKPKLNELGIKLGRDGLFDYLREHRLLVKPKRSYTKTTDSRHWMKKHPNLVQDLHINRPEQVFVSDITYVESAEGVHYLSLVTDRFSRKIMGYHLSENMTAVEVVKAVKQALKARVTSDSLIHHSDRGSQYCSALYQAELRKNGVSPSMTDGYDCYQNALAERINGILKQEFLLLKCNSFKELKRLIEESIQIYNTIRPHLSLGMKTPEEVHKKATLRVRVAT